MSIFMKKLARYYTTSHLGTNIGWGEIVKSHIQSINSLNELDHFENKIIKRRLELLDDATGHISDLIPIKPSLQGVDPIDYEEYKNKYNCFEPPNTVQFGKNGYLLSKPSFK
jgi:hypothetical protein